MSSSMQSEQIQKSFLQKNGIKFLVLSLIVFIFILLQMLFKIEEKQENSAKHSVFTTMLKHLQNKNPDEEKDEFFKIKDQFIENLSKIPLQSYTADLNKKIKQFNSLMFQFYLKTKDNKFLEDLNQIPLSKQVFTSQFINEIKTKLDVNCDLKNIPGFGLEFDYNFEDDSQLKDFNQDSNSWQIKEGQLFYIPMDGKIRLNSLLWKMNHGKNIKIHYKAKSLAKYKGGNLNFIIGGDHIPGVFYGPGNLISVGWAGEQYVAVLNMMNFNFADDYDYGKLHSNNIVKKIEFDYTNLAEYQMEIKLKNNNIAVFYNGKEIYSGFSKTLKKSGFTGPVAYNKTSFSNISFKIDAKEVFDKMNSFVTYSIAPTKISKTNSDTQLYDSYKIQNLDGLMVFSKEYQNKILKNTYYLPFLFDLTKENFKINKTSKLKLYFSAKSNTKNALKLFVQVKNKKLKRKKIFNLLLKPIRIRKLNDEGGKIFTLNEFEIPLEKLRHFKINKKVIFVLNSKQSFALDYASLILINE